MERRTKRGLAPIALMPLGFMGVLIVGTVLLMLPFSTTDGHGLNFVDSVFMASSAVCVTGLSVKDLGTELTVYGQAVMLLLIQCGGLGFMTLTSMLFMMLGRRFSLHDRMNLAESMAQDKLQGVVKMTKYAIFITLTIELVGVMLLAIRFVPDFGWKRGLWYSVFHSVSAFCNAGFDILGNGSSFIPYVNDVLVNITLMLLIVLGGLGFAVIVNIMTAARKRIGKTDTEIKRLRLHSKVVLLMTAILLIAGAVLIFALEYRNPKTFANIPMQERILPSLFQSVTARTAGFASIPQTDLTHESKLVTCILMFVGASPAGTGGGIKTTTLAIVLLFIWAVMRNRQDIELFKRRLSWGIVRRALSIFFLALGVIAVGVLLLSVFERGKPFTPGDMAFEVISAVTTTGLSTGITGSLSSASRLLLSLIMFMGRVGVLTVALNIGGLTNKNTKNIQYPLEDIPVG